MPPEDPGPERWKEGYEAQAFPARTSYQRQCRQTSSESGLTAAILSDRKAQPRLLKTAQQGKQGHRGKVARLGCGCCVKNLSKRQMRVTHKLFTICSHFQNAFYWHSEPHLKPEQISMSSLGIVVNKVSMCLGPITEE